VTAGQAKGGLGAKKWRAAALTLAGVGGTADDLKINSLGLDATLKQDGRTVAAKLATPVQASLANGRYALSKLDGQINIEDPSVSKAASSLKLGGSVSADIKKETAMANLTALLDKANMALKAGVNGFKTPKINVELDADEINVDQLFPAPKTTTAAAEPAPASTARACRMRASDWARVRLPLCWRASRWVSTGSSKAAPLSSVTVASGAGIWLASAEAGWPVPCCPAAPCPALLSPLRPESVPRAPS